MTSLAGQILIETETPREKGAVTQVCHFHNCPKVGAVYVPQVSDCRRLRLRGTGRA